MCHVFRKNEKEGEKNYIIGNNKNLYKKVPKMKAEKRSNILKMLHKL
jgi:hypothetical protein